VRPSMGGAACTSHQRDTKSTQLQTQMGLTTILNCITNWTSDHNPKAHHGPACSNQPASPSITVRHSTGLSATAQQTLPGMHTSVQYCAHQANLIPHQFLARTTALRTIHQAHGRHHCATHAHKCTACDRLNSTPHTSGPTYCTLCRGLLYVLGNDMFLGRTDDTSDRNKSAMRCTHTNTHTHTTDTRHIGLATAANNFSILPQGLSHPALDSRLPGTTQLNSHMQNPAGLACYACACSCNRANWPGKVETI
jgi:hypothetical protein